MEINCESCGELIFRQNKKQHMNSFPCKLKTFNNKLDEHFVAPELRNFINVRQKKKYTTGAILMSYKLLELLRKSSFDKDCPYNIFVSIGGMGQAYNDLEYFTKFKIEKHVKEIYRNSNRKIK